jgi:[CysO sulfur-carrier protein]-S-L-cysteine hydrolase
LKLINKDKNLELIIDDDLLNNIALHGLMHYPNEFGGFLVGHYSADFKALYVSNSILPKKYRGFPTSFERGNDGLKEVLDKLFDNKKQFYVGEWHTHPNGSTMYSQTDLNAMIKIEAFEAVQIKNPILLILSIQNNKMTDFTFYVYNDKQLIRYE